MFTLQKVEYYIFGLKHISFDLTSDFAKSNSKMIIHILSICFVFVYTKMNVFAKRIKV